MPFMIVVITKDWWQTACAFTKIIIYHLESTIKRAINAPRSFLFWRQFYTIYSTSASFHHLWIKRNCDNEIHKSHAAADSDSAATTVDCQQAAKDGEKRQIIRFKFALFFFLSFFGNTREPFALHSRPSHLNEYNWIDRKQKQRKRSKKIRIKCLMNCSRQQWADIK